VTSLLLGYNNTQRSFTISVPLTPGHDPNSKDLRSCRRRNRNDGHGRTGSLLVQVCPASSLFNSADPLLAPTESNQIILSDPLERLSRKEQEGLRLRSSPGLALARFVEPIRCLPRLWDGFSRRYRTCRRLPFQLGVLPVAHVE
jgi:hypothetical protein